MADRFASPPGTHDVLAPESDRWQRFIAHFAQMAGRAGYGLIQNPMFEDVGVFSRVGEATDIVSKEMYAFTDRGGRDLALRPEGTASVVRAFIQHRPTTPYKAFYVGPKFRYERAQAGRYRQHHQVGVEVLGSADADVDVEVIALAWGVLAGIGLRQNRLLINSLGDPESRAAYREALVAHLEPHRDAMGPNDLRRLEQNPLRVLDTRDPNLADVVAAAPDPADHLNETSAAHFARVRAGLDALGIAYEVAPRLVRGLDYYTHTLFEIQSDALDAAQSAVGGGGRYDGLAEALGGPVTPGMGFGMGIERVLLAADAEGVFPASPSTVDVFVVDVVDGLHALRLTHALRDAGIAADRAFDGRSMKSQLKSADRTGARVAVIVGSDEADGGVVTVRDLSEGTQESVPADQLIEAVRRRLDASAERTS